jgi:hypothetical protein
VLNPVPGHPRQYSREPAATGDAGDDQAESEQSDEPEEERVNQCAFDQRQQKQDTERDLGLTLE